MDKTTFSQTKIKSDDRVPLPSQLVTQYPTENAQSSFNGIRVAGKLNLKIHYLFSDDGVEFVCQRRI